MANNLAATEIRVASTGAIYVAPVGTAQPANISSTLDAALRNLGYATTDGVRLSRSIDTETVNSWQAVAPQRYLLTGVSLTTAFDLQQMNKDTLPLYLGGGTVTNQGGSPVSYKYSILAAPVIDERMMVIVWSDGTLNYRLVIPRGMVSETGEMTLGRGSEIQLPITFSAMTPAGTDLAYLLTDDPSFA